MDTHYFLLDRKDAFETSTPEEQGITSASIADFFDTVRERDLEVDSIQIVRHGKLCLDAVAAPYTRDSFHRIYSAAKGVVATAILFAVQEGLIELDSPVVPLLPARWIPEDLDERWNRLTVYHLLTMTTGHDRDTMFEMWKRDCWIRTFFEVKPVYEPGTYFLYDMGAQYVMNEIIANLTGQTTGEYLEERLFRKIGIEYTNNFTKPEGLFFSSTMQFKPDGLTRFSQFYLNKGRWNGEQILREDLAVLAGEHHGPSSHFVSGKREGSYAGYALHMWRNKGGGFRFSGGQGQFGIILPDEDMAVGILSCANDGDAIVDVFFDTIFADCRNHPIERDPWDAARTDTMVAELSLAPYRTSPHSYKEQVYGAKYVLQENPWGQKAVEFQFRTDSVLIRTESDDGKKEVICGLENRFPVSEGYILSPKKPEEIEDIDHNFGYDEKKTMYSGGWRDPDTFEFVMRSDSFLSDHRFSCRFMGDLLEIRMSNNTVNSRSRYRDRKTAPDAVLKGCRA